MCNPTHESLASQAAAYLRESAGAIGGFNGIQKEIRRQACFLVKWARANGVFLTETEFPTSDLEKHDEVTAEHVVYLKRSDRRRIIKCTKPGKFGRGHGPKGRYGIHPDATPLFYLERLDLLNQEFPTDLRLEGIAFSSSGDGGKALPCIVVSQRFIEASDPDSPHPSEEAIQNFMLGLQFTLLPDSVYNWIRESDGIVVTDTRQSNFIAAGGDIYPIDLIISRINPP